jgi:hypothetical protein
MNISKDTGMGEERDFAVHLTGFLPARYQRASSGG